ncbi:MULTISPECIES: hypothetical protein [Brevibacterium]|uniref:hypothetical protein n=1 Tax=Brevibacterium TaxID=1696 RepID=UPI00223AEC93|nr:MULTISPECIES: hypothetical protein [Brevibacterium]MCT1890679.1 hypothetical protein [Brevibacterium luteolum]MCT1922459.1 hypothetical protein [Brevibacterium luteolum]MCT1924276.1 hypothetical protein [Brevibacterium luteolum]
MDDWASAAARYMYVAGAGLIVAGVASVFLTEAALAIVALAGCVWVLAWVLIASRVATTAAARE